MSPTAKQAKEQESGRIIWWILAAFILLGVSYWLIGSTHSPLTTTKTPTPKQEVTQLTPIKNPKPSPVVKVAYDANGFNPAQLTIKKDTTVVFTASSGEFHIVSALPGFNSVSDVSQYAFTFSQAGAFAYQNADNSAQTGTVSVTP